MVEALKYNENIMNFAWQIMTKSCCMTLYSSGHNLNECMTKSFCTILSTETNINNLFSLDRM